MHSESDFTLLGNLFETYLGQPFDAIVRLPESGSSRRYYRMRHGNDQYIGTVNTVVAENIAYFSIHEALKKSHVPVPEIFMISADRTTYLQEDLGDQSLFNVIGQLQTRPDFETQLSEVFHAVLAGLVRIQTQAIRQMNDAHFWPAARFDRQAILSDLHYFFYYFVKQFPELQVNEYRLQTEFDLLAGIALEAPSEYFMYRDFQSRNIIIKDNKPYFIDFQGGRRGPLQYDLVSLLYQVKAALPQDFRDRMTEFYVQLLSRETGIDASDFNKHLTVFVYLRLLQVLGAYGFRGIIQKKPHFLQSIPPALREIGALIKRNPLPDALPELKSLLLQISTIRLGLPQSHSELLNQLTVTVSSFSFLKKGVPVDYSGNGGGFVFDCRILPNPGRLPAYANLTGADVEVAQFLEKEASVGQFLAHVKEIISQAVSNYSERGFKNLMVNFGCSGGLHRSVYCALQVSKWLSNNFASIRVVTIHHEQADLS